MPAVIAPTGRASPQRLPPIEPRGWRASCLLVRARRDCAYQPCVAPSPVLAEYCASRGRGSMANAPLRMTIEHLESFAIGAWIMGTGGGGDPYFSLLEARQHWAEGKSVDLIDPMSLGDDDLIACVGQ